MRSPARTGLAALLALAPLLAACHPTVMGNGVFAEESRSVPAFDRLSVAFGFHVQVTVASGPRSVVISGDENVIEHVSLTVTDSVLRTEADASLESVHPLQLRITAPELVGVEAVEGSRVAAAGITASAFQVRAVEGSHVTVSGAPAAGATLGAFLDTGSVLDAHAMPVSSAAVTLASHSEASLLCSGPVTGTARDTSSVTVQGGGSCEVALTPAPPAAGASTCTATAP